MTKKAKKIRNTFRNRIIRLFLSFTLGMGAFTLLKGPLIGVAAAAEKVGLDLYLLENDVAVGTRVDERAYRQISYNYKGSVKNITDERRTNSDPDTDGEYVTWMSQVGSRWQIFLHHIPTEETIQLTSFGNNVNPAVSGKLVVWEGQVNGIWQIFLYDGVKIVQLTRGDTPSQNAGVDNGFVVYDTKNPDGEGWDVFLYDVEQEETTQLNPFLPGRNPQIAEGVVTWTVVIGGESLTYKFFVDGADDFRATVDGEVFDEEAFEEFVETLEATESTEAVVDSFDEEKELEKPPAELDTVTPEDILEELVEVTESTESTGSVEGQ